jgi:hypothetical protein
MSTHFKHGVMTASAPPEGQFELSPGICRPTADSQKSFIPGPAQQMKMLRHNQ